VIRYECPNCGENMGQAEVCPCCHHEETTLCCCPHCEEEGDRELREIEERQALMDICSGRWADDWE
jgi:hypothetical protein